MISNVPSNMAELSSLAGLLTGEAGDLPAWSENEFLARLDHHGIAMLAHHDKRLPAAVRQSLKPRKAMMIANEVLKQRALNELFDAFRTEGLSQVILFKGSALAYSIYETPWLRPRTDSDCLIDESQLDRFESVFVRLGYHKLFAIDGRHIHYQCTFSKALAGQSAINIDLHWRVNNRQLLAGAYSVGELLERSIGVPALSPHIRIPCPTDSMLIACLHRLGHHLKEERLTWLYDIHLLAQTMNRQQWAEMATRATQKQIAGITLDALHYCTRLFDSRIDERAFAVLQEAAQTDEPSQLFLRRNLPEWRYFWHDLKGLNGWRDKASAIWENLVPPPAYVRRQMGTRWATLGYLKRLLRGVRRAQS